MSNLLFELPKKKLEKNRLYCGDCLGVLEKLKEENIKVDLIYLDPPFNSNKIYNIIFRRGGVTAQQKAFDDTWTGRIQIKQLLLDLDCVLEQEHIDETVRIFLKAWIEPLKEQNRATDRKLLSYLLYMARRLIAMKDILSDTGSIYYHCDPTASHYIKIIMDGIFKRANFKNELIWHYENKLRDGRKRIWQKATDTIFFYSKTKDYYFKVFKDPLPAPKKYTKIQKVNGKKVTVRNEKGEVQYVYSTAKISDNVFRIPMLTTNRLGYPTEKPVPLLDRIIKASCLEGGIVLDPFCGCGTTVEAAIKNNRQYIGIDISKYAIDIMKSRLYTIAINESDYNLIFEDPKGIEEYEKMDAYKKQHFAIKKIGGTPNERKSGDGGIDGDLKIHLGFNDDGKDVWGKMVFSVKSGNQRNPAHVRELIGTMHSNNYAMAGLIIDCDPTLAMEQAAEKGGELKYYRKDKSLPPDVYDRVQILTIDQIINQKIIFDTPYTVVELMTHRERQQRTAVLDL